MLVDPYYADNNAAGTRTLQLMRRWYHFAVGNGDLLFPPGITDVTVELGGGGVVTTDPPPEALWARVVCIDDAYVVHLINPTDQCTLECDAPHEAPFYVAEDPRVVSAPAYDKCDSVAGTSGGNRSLLVR